MLQVLYAIVGVPDAIAGESPIPGYIVNASLSVDPMDPPNTYDFSVIFDTNGNGVPDTAVVGKVTFSEDPTDGLDPGATLDFSFTVQNTPVVTGAPFETGTLTGSGDLLATLSADTSVAELTGTVDLVDTAGDGCEAELTFPVATPFILDFSGAPQAQLAANLVLVEIYGTIEALIESLGHSLETTLTILQGDQTVDGTGSVDGTTDFDFSFEVLPSDEEIQELFECGLNGGEMIDVLVNIYDTVIQSGVLTGGPPPPGVVVTATGNPTVFNYTADLALLDPGHFTAATLSGQATLIFPVIAGLLPSEVDFTWTLSGGALTSPPGTTITGNSTRALRLRLDGGGGLLSFSGAGTFHISRPALAGISTGAIDCTVTVDIPDTDPISESNNTGLAFITVIAGDNTMKITIDVAQQTIYASINGIPFPFFIF